VKYIAMDYTSGRPQIQPMSNTKSSKRILIVVTSHAKLGSTDTPTGFWLEELAVPYQVFRDAGAQVDIASPAGGRAPADPKSEKDTSEAVTRFLADPEATAKLADTLRLDTLTESYDAVFLAGGHGTMWDLPESRPLAALLGATHDRGGVVAAVCHGPAGLVAARRKDGRPLIDGLRVAGFSDEEEAAVGLTSIVPFLLETRLKELGGRYERGPMWAPFAVSDTRLVTGQNPASSRKVAEETLAALQA
jgi:putative intracellular protease/amidase